MERPVEAQLVQAPHRRGRLGLAQQVHQLVSHPRPRHGAKHARRRRRAGEALGRAIHSEAEPNLVADGAKQAGRIIDEAAGVEHAHDPLLEVRTAAAGVVEVAEIVARQPHRHRVDREVAPAEVLVKRRLLDSRQGARLVVRLAPSGGEVEHQVVGAHRGGAKALVLARDPAEPIGQGPGYRASVSFDGYVEVDGIGVAEQVAHGAAHEVGGRQSFQGRQQAPHAGEATYALAQVHLAPRHHRRTGIPASRIRSLASRTVWCP